MILDVRDSVLSDSLVDIELISSHIVKSGGILGGPR